MHACLAQFDTTHASGSIPPISLAQVDEYLFPLIRAGLMDGSLKTFRLEVERGRLPGQVVDALNASLPDTIGAWYKYEPKLVETSRFEIVGVKYQKNPGLQGEWKEFSISAFRAQPDIMEEAKEVAASSGAFWVHFRIKSTPLIELMTGDRDFKLGEE